MQSQSRLSLVLAAAGFAAILFVIWLCDMRQSRHSTVTVAAATSPVASITDTHVADAQVAQVPARVLPPTPKADKKDKPKQSPKESKEHQIFIGGLLYDFSRNEVNAVAEYKGRRLLICGSVARVGILSGVPYISLLTGEYRRNVVFAFTKADDVRKTATGVKIVISGYLTSWSPDIVFTKCKIEPLAPEWPPGTY